VISRTITIPKKGRPLAEPVGRPHPSGARFHEGHVAEPGIIYKIISGTGSFDQDSGRTDLLVQIVPEPDRRQAGFVETPGEFVRKLPGEAHGELSIRVQGLFESVVR
jgi:hypothetical protein